MKVRWGRGQRQGGKGEGSGSGDDAGPGVEAGGEVEARGGCGYTLATACNSTSVENNYFF